MKQKLQTRLAQQLVLTPRLQQSIRLLQLSAVELDEEIERALQTNPLLERWDDPLANTLRFLPDGSLVGQSLSLPLTNEITVPVGDSLNRADNDWEMAEPRERDSLLWKTLRPATGQSDDERFQPQLQAPPESLKEHLLSQMRLTVRTQRQRALVELIIDALDSNGYVQETPDEMLEWLPEELHIQKDELENALASVQHFDPPGVGARNSAECLALQIRSMPNVPYVVRKRALSVVENHLNLFARRDFARLKKVLDCDDDDLQEARDVIFRCNPHPGAVFSPETARTVVSEIIVSRQEGRWQAKLNPDTLPKLRINRTYSSIIKNATGKTTLNTQLQEAGWLIKNIDQRFETLLKVSEAIVSRQQNFFSFGPASMRPLVLREIADTLGLHESTISRVTTQKYMLTPLGIFELKYFFGSHVATETGGEASSTAVREKIKQLIVSEDRKKPYSDNKIAQILQKEGVVIARRTVAKYREILKIPTAGLRKTL